MSEEKRSLDCHIRTVDRGCAKCSSLESKSRCSICKIPYCNIVCQRGDWQTHKLSCKTTEMWRLAIVNVGSHALCLYYSVFSCAIGNLMRTSISPGVLNEIERTTFHLDHDAKEIKVCEEVIKWSNLNSTLQSMAITGCLTAEAFPLLFLDLLKGERKASLSGRDLAPIALLQLHSNFQTLVRSERSIALGINSKIESSPGVMRVESYPGVTLSRVMKEDLELSQRAIYTISFRRTDIPDPPFWRGARTAILDEWKFITSRYDDSDPHTLSIFINRTEGFIVQGYQGSYSYNGWLAFNDDLKREEGIAPPASPEFFAWRAIEPRPTYRKILGKLKLIKLAEDIDQLSTEREDHEEILASIVGIRYNPKLVGKFYTTRFYRTLL